MTDTLESISQEMYNKSYKDLIYRVGGEIDGGERQRTVQLELCRRENAELKTYKDKYDKIVTHFRNDDLDQDQFVPAVYAVINGVTDAS